MPLFYLSGTPGGATTQLQYNNAGAFGGISGITTDGSTVLTFTGGTVTVSTPLINITQTWNAGGVAFSCIKVNITNTASNGGASAVLDLQTGGNQRLIVNPVGSMILHSAAAGAAALAIGIDGDTSNRMVVGVDASNNPFMGMGPGGSSSRDVFLVRDAVAHLSDRNSTNAQRFSVYSTFTSSTSYERLDLDWITTANLCIIGVQKGSGGGTYRSLALQTSALSRILIDLNGNVALNGGQAALATSATDGFTYIATCAGTPTGIPTAVTGAVPMVFDTTNSQFWFYTGGAWKQPKTPAGAAIVTWQ